MSLESLYQEVILDHAENPHNYGEMDAPHLSYRLRNPTCGDDVTVHLVLDDEQRVAAIRFTGDGCSISQASASMMMDVVEGKHVDEVHAMIARFREMLVEGVEPDASLGDLEALQGVRKFPTRVRCATLSWHALEALLKEQAGA